MTDKLRQVFEAGLKRYGIELDLTRDGLSYRNNQTHAVWRWFLDYESELSATIQALQEMTDVVDVLSEVNERAREMQGARYDG